MQNQLVETYATLSSLWENSNKKIVHLIVLMKNKISSYEGLMIAHMELEDNKWLEGIRRYLESRE